MTDTAATFILLRNSKASDTWQVEATMEYPTDAYKEDAEEWATALLTRMLPDVGTRFRLVMDLGICEIGYIEPPSTPPEELIQISFEL